MESLFKNEYTVTIDLMREWTKHPITKKAIMSRRKSLALRIFGCFVALFILAGSFILKDISYTIIGGLFFVYFMFRMFILPETVLKKQYKQAQNMMGNKPWIRAITFADNILIEDGRHSTRFEYSDFISFLETSEYFILIGLEMALRVRKDSFILGTVADFRNFINKNYNGTLEEK